MSACQKYFLSCRQAVFSPPFLSFFFFFFFFCFVYFSFLFIFLVPCWCPIRKDIADIWHQLFCFVACVLHSMAFFIFILINLVPPFYFRNIFVLCIRKKGKLLHKRFCLIWEGVTNLSLGFGLFSFFCISLGEHHSLNLFSFILQCKLYFIALNTIFLLFF